MKILLTWAATVSLLRLHLPPLDVGSLGDSRRDLSLGWCSPVEVLDHGLQTDSGYSGRGGKESLLGEIMKTEENIFSIKPQTLWRSAVLLSLDNWPRGRLEVEPRPRGMKCPLNQKIKFNNSFDKSGSKISQ